MQRISATATAAMVAALLAGAASPAAAAPEAQPGGKTYGFVATWFYRANVPLDAPGNCPNGKSQPVSVPWMIPG